MPVDRGLPRSTKRRRGGKSPGVNPLIVVGDGNTVHKAKGRAEEQGQQRTDAAARRPRKSVSSSLLAIGQKAEAEPKHRFEDLYGMINAEMLIECFHLLKRLD